MKCLAGKGECKMRNSIIMLLIPAAKMVAKYFFKQEYLKGRWFDENNNGWKWCLRGIWQQKILGFNRSAPFPMSPFTLVSDYNKIHFHPDNLDNFQSPGCYFQCFSGHIYIGHGTYIAPNVGIITANHDPTNLDVHLEGKDVVIGENCWIGMNSVILPGVVLGERTIVAAGSVVNRSFNEGHLVIGGVPAKEIKKVG